MDHDHFWKCIQHEFGEVHTHLQNILRIQSLCNHSLRLLTRESIMAIENDMRELADFFVDSCKKSTSFKEPSVRDIYGARWEAKPKEFCFLEGEILCLLGLAEHVKKRGVEPFLKFSKNQATFSGPTSSAQKPIVLDRARAETYVSNLEQKIKRIYTSQQIQHDPEFDRFVEQLKHLEVQWLSTTWDKDNQLRAAVVCPVCAAEGHDRRIRLKVDTNGRWHVFSFTRHCDTFHYVLPRAAKRKQFFDADDVDDVMDDSVSESAHFEVEMEIKVEEKDDGPLGYFITS